MVSGPTGSGKTTSLYSMLARLGRPACESERRAALIRIRVVDTPQAVSFCGHATSGEDVVVVEAWDA